MYNLIDKFVTKLINIRINWKLKMWLVWILIIREYSYPICQSTCVDFNAILRASYRLAFNQNDYWRFKVNQKFNTRSRNLSIIQIFLCISCLPRCYEKKNKSTLCLQMQQNLIYCSNRKLLILRELRQHSSELFFNFFVEYYCD